MCNDHGHSRPTRNRREFLRDGLCGFGSIALASLLHQQQVRAGAVIRSCYADVVVHSAAQYQLFTGRIVPGFPSMGSWVTYGLGSESESLPGYVVMPDPHGALEGGQPIYANGFLPAAYQPTLFRP